MVLSRLREQIQELLLTFVMMAILLSAGLIIALNLAVGDGRMLEGSAINGIDVSGMDAIQAENALLDAIEKNMLDSFSLTVQAGEAERAYASADFRLSTDVSARMHELLAPLSTGGLLQKADTLYDIRSGVELDFSIKYSVSAVDQAAWAFAAALYQEPVNASLTIDPVTHEFTYEKEAAGRQIDAKALSNRIQEQLGRGDYSPISLELDVVNPMVTQESLRENIVLLSTYELGMPDNGDYREQIGNMIDALNGSVMEPGQDFSLREVFEAHDIMLSREEEPASRVGAGFYCAALLADAAKVERNQNTALPSYVEEGFGAAVSQTQDLVMRCDSPVPLYVVASAKKDSFKIEIYGRRERDMPEIRLRGAIDSVVKPEQPIFVSDDTMRKNKQELVTAAQDGCRVSSYREYYQGETILKSELLALDRYPSVQAVYRVGTR